jgi:hypothetical protein
MAEQIKRIDVGFSGGQVLTVRATKETHDKLVKALGSDGKDRFFTLKTEESEVTVDLAEVVYVRRDTDEHKVGF